MIISHKHKFIFVKTRKTAGTSLEIALSDICGPEDIITPITRKDEKQRKQYSKFSAQNYKMPLAKYTNWDYFRLLTKRKIKRFYNHMPCGEIRQYVSDDVWNTYFKFTIERNPFDKMVSVYYWRRGDERFESIYDFLQNGGLKEFTSYDIYSIDGVVAVDHIYRYEDLQGMGEDLARRLNLDRPLALPAYKAKSSSRKVADYKELLDPDSVELIKTIYAREIRLLGYTF